MKHSTRIIALVLGLCATHGWAQNPGGFKIKNRSSFTSIETLRNPFWPIGVTPGIPNATVALPQAVPQKPTAKPEDFNLTSISSFGGTRMAMISGKPAGEGETVSINLGGQRVKIQIVKVTDGSVVVRYQGQEITVTLKRPELELISRPVKQEPVLHSSED